MKWIVKRDFYRTPQLKDIVITDACRGATKDSPHPKHIHTGAIFELGKFADEAEFKKTPNDDPVKILLANLRVVGCIGDASDAVIVARVESEIETRSRRAATEAAMDKRADTAGISAAFIELM